MDNLFSPTQLKCLEKITGKENKVKKKKAYIRMFHTSQTIVHKFLASELHSKMVGEAVKCHIPIVSAPNKLTGKKHCILAE